MKLWYGTAVLALGLATATLADTPAPGNVAPIQTPAIVIHADRHASSHAMKFSSILNKNAFWRGEASKKGYDVAFTEWMQQDHPWEYAAVCVKMAEQVKTNAEHTGHISEFNAATNKDAGLRNEVQTAGSDAAFLDWLRTHHPDSYKNELTKAQSQVQPSK